MSRQESPLYVGFHQGQTWISHCTQINAYRGPAHSRLSGFFANDFLQSAKTVLSRNTQKYPNS